MKPAHLTVETATPPGAAARVLRLAGPLTLANTAVFQQAFERSDGNATILDLTQVSYVDSAGLGVLVNAHINSYKAGRRLALVAVSAPVLKIMRQAHADRLFDFFATLEDARKALGSG